MAESVAGALVVDIIPGGITSAVKQITSAFKKAGADAAKQTAAAYRAALDSANDVQAASAKIAKARAAESDAAGRVKIAETQLAEARQKYAGDSAKVVAAEERLATAQRAVATRADETSIAEGRLAAAQRKAGDAAEAQSAKSGTLLKTLGTVGLAVGAVGVAMGVKAVQAAANFQTSQERLVTTAGESSKNLKMVSDGILNLAGAVGYSAQDLSKGMYTVESAGYHGADALNVLKASAQGAKEENADLGTVTDAVSSVMRDYHLSTSDAATVTSKLVTAVGDGKSNFEDFTGALSAVLPKASAAHVSLNDILGDLSSMTLHGMSAEQASQNLADALSHLSNPTSVMTKELASLGINSADLSKNLGKTGVSGAMNEIAQAILEHMGPAGTTLLNAFNKSQVAAQDAKTMFDSLPASLRGVASGYQDGSLSLAQWRSALKKLPADQVVLLNQWRAMQDQSKGFNAQLKSGGPAAQTFSQAMAKATGDSASMNVALMLTGENAAKTQQNIKDVAKASTEAGGNVKGWSDIQNTFNQKMAEAKDALGAMAIKVGNVLLPFFTKLMNVVKDVANWLANHPLITTIMIGLMVGYGLAVVGATVAMVAMNAIFAIMTVAVYAGATAWAVLRAAMMGNPIAIIILAIIAAVTLLVIYWKPVWGAIKTAAIAVWDALKVAFHAVVAAIKAVGDAAVWLWNNAIHPAFNAVVVAVKAVGTAAVWLWNNAIHPAFNGIVTVAKWLFAILFTVVFTPLILLWKAVAAIAVWLWHNVLQPAFQGIAAVAIWLYNNMLKPIFTGIMTIIKAVGTVAVWLWKNVIVPAWQGIGIIANWLYDHVFKPIFNAIVVIIKAVATAATWLWKNVIVPAWQGIGIIGNWLYDHIFKPVFNAIITIIKAVATAGNWLWKNALEPAFKGIGTAAQWVWDHILKPVFNAFSDAFHAIYNAAEWVWKHLGSVWDGIKAVFEAPVKWVIDVIWNNGIAAAWNWIASKVGLPQLGKVDTSKWAGGGVVPGYAPGQDTIPAVLSPGEAVLVPEAVQMLGVNNILALNRQASGRPPSSGSRGYSGGGYNPYGASGNSGGNGVITNNPAAKQTGDVVGELLNLVGGAASKIAGFIANPIGTIKAAVSKGGQWITAIGKFFGQGAGQILKGLWNKVTGWFGSLFSSGKQSAVKGTAAHNLIIDQALLADGIGRQDWGKWEAGLNTLITRESNWNPTAVNNWDSNAAKGTPSKGLAQVIQPTFDSYRNPALPNDLLNPISNVAAAINYIISRYGDISAVQQANPNLPPKGYDNGGWLEPGFTRVVNATGKPEAVFTNSQWETLRANIGTGKSGDTFNITSHNPESVAEEIARRQRAKLRAATI